MPSDFDRDLRRLHASARDAVSPHTLARLRQARHATLAHPPRGRSSAWLGVSAGTALLAVVLATQLLPLRQSAPATWQPTTAVLQNSQDADDVVDTTDVLDQNPDLYVWLGSNASLAME